MKDLLIDKATVDLLQDHILKILEAHIDGISEYELLKQAQRDSVFPTLSGEANVLMFREHFLLMHCLYKLQKKLACEKKYHLCISPIRITLETTSIEDSGNTALNVNSSDEALKKYYLDWTHFESTHKEDVDKLFDSFWKDYARHISGDDALDILGLPKHAGQQEIQRRYRELAALHHPDKGGDKDSFIQIRSAYEILSSKS